MRFRLGLLVAGFLAVSGFGTAGVYVFTTNPGDTNNGEAVKASATFTTNDNGSITIVLANLLTAAQVNSVASNLSDLFFTLSDNVTATVNDANRSYTGTLINVDGSGNVTPGSGLFNGWDLSGGGHNFLLEDLGSAAGPAQTIIGGAGAASYPNANGSIDGNGPHNPFIQGSATFTLTGFTGVTHNTAITGATFSFNTTLGQNIPGHLTPTPEPKVMSFVLVAGLLVLSRFRRKNVELS